MLAELGEVAAASGLHKVKLRLCTDLRFLNEIVVDVPFSYCNVFTALALVMDLFADVGKQDARAMFWSFPVAPGDSSLLGFEVDGQMMSFPWGLPTLFVNLQWMA